MSAEKAPLQRNFRGLAPEARRGKRRAQLVEAAIEAFGQRGFHAVTVREICVGARLTERYFYESFSGLDALFAATLQHLNAELHAATLRVIAAPQADPAALAEAALRVFLDYVRDDPRRARIMLVDAVSIGHDTRRIAEAATRGYVNLMSGFIRALMPQAAALGLDPELIATGLVGANIHVATRWLHERCATPLEEVLSNLMAIYHALIAQVGRASATAKRRRGTHIGKDRNRAARAAVTRSRGGGAR